MRRLAFRMPTARKAFRRRDSIQEIGVQAMKLGALLPVKWWKERRCGTRETRSSALETVWIFAADSPPRSRGGFLNCRWDPFAPSLMWWSLLRVGPSITIKLIGRLFLKTERRCWRMMRPSQGQFAFKMVVIPCRCLILEGTDGGRLI